MTSAGTLIGGAALNRSRPRQMPLLYCLGVKSLAVVPNIPAGHMQFYETAMSDRYVIGPCLVRHIIRWSHRYY